MVDLCLSGGCRGADVLFGELAESNGHGVQHFSFPGHSHYSKPEHLVVLSPLQLVEAQPWLKQAGHLLERVYPPAAVYTDCLLMRNYYQVKTSERVYATTWLDKVGKPGGGTGWTVTMGILLGIPEIYVHNKKNNSWFKWNSHQSLTDWRFNWSWGWTMLDERPPKPHGTYTGIGSHDIVENQRMAIRKLYE